MRDLVVLVVRDPDGDTYVDLYRNGWRLDPHEYTIEEVDAGRGYDYKQDWLPRIEEAEALPPSDYRTDLLAALYNPPGRGDIDGWPDDLPPRRRNV
jgi:hypothetical protein